MSEIAKIIGDYGILTAIAIVFIFNTIQDRKDKKEQEVSNGKRDEKYNESLSLLAKAIDNMGNLIDLLKQSNDNQAEVFKQHDERSICIKEDLIEIKTLVGNCPKKK